MSSDRATDAQAVGVMELDISSTDWFDGPFFTTKTRRHKEKPGAPPEQRPFLNRRFRRWRRCPEGGKIKLVGDQSMGSGPIYGVKDEWRLVRQGKVISANATGIQPSDDAAG